MLDPKHSQDVGKCTHSKMRKFITGTCKTFYCHCGRALKFRHGTQFEVSQTNSSKQSMEETLATSDDEKGNESSQELILSSSPKTSQGAKQYDMYMYEGFWYPHVVKAAALSSFHEYFRVQDSDILLASFPKCGTTWLKAMIYSIVNRERYSIGSEDHPLLTNNPHALIPCIEMDLPFSNNVVPDVGDVPAPRLFATHSPAISLSDEVMRSSCKIIYLCRNPKGCFISMWHHYKKLWPAGVDAISIDEALDKFCDGECPFGPFWDHVLGHWKASLTTPEKVLFLRYEQVRKLPSHYVKEIASFLGFPFSGVEEGQGMVDGIVELCSFSHLSQLKVNKSGRHKNEMENSVFFRLGETEDWKNHLSPEMMSKIDQINEEKFSLYGLEI